MSRIRSLGTFFIFILLMVSMVTMVGASPEVIVDPPKSTGRAGDTFRVDVKAVDVTNIVAWQFNLSWDPSVLSFSNWYTLPFLTRKFLYESSPLGVDTGEYTSQPTAYDNSSGFEYKTSATAMDVTLPVDGFDDTRNPAAWTRVGASPYLDAKDEPTNYIYTSEKGNYAIGDFTFADKTVGAGEVLGTVQLSLYAKGGGDYIKLWLWDGSTWTLVDTITPAGTYTDYPYDVYATLNTWDKVNGAKIYLEYAYSGGASVSYADEAHLYVTYTELVTLDPSRAYDGSISTQTKFSFGQDGYMEFQSFQVTPYPYTVSNVDLRMYWVTNGSTDSVPDKYRIAYTVPPSAATTVLTDWTNASFGVPPIFPGLPWEPKNRTWPSLVEPNDGVWNWTDINHLRLRVDTDLNGTSDNANIAIGEVWALVSYIPVDVTDPAKAYDGNNATYASFKYEVDSNFTLVSFPIPSYEDYRIDWLDFKMRYEAEGATDDRYRIVYSVTPHCAAANTTKMVLEDWTSDATTLGTYVWHDQYEPNDGEWDTYVDPLPPGDILWSWDDVAYINFMVETDVVGESDNKEFRLYEGWVTVQYYRKIFGAGTLETDSIFIGYSCLGDVDGVSGTGTLAVIWFKVLDDTTSSNLDLNQTKLIDPFGTVDHATVDGAYIPPWDEDVDADGYIDIMDLVLVGMNFGNTGEDIIPPEADINGDNIVDIEDLVAIALLFSSGSYL